MVVVNVYVVDTMKSIYVIESSIQKSAVVFPWQRAQNNTWLVTQSVKDPVLKKHQLRETAAKCLEMSKMGELQ